MTQLIMYPEVAEKIALGTKKHESLIRAQIIEKSKQDHIYATCPDDKNRRFTDELAFLKWSREAGSVILSFMDNEDLAGIVFFREKTHELAQSSATFALRIYEGYTGQGLSKQLMRESHSWLFDTATQTENADFQWIKGAQSVWLSVLPDNHPALRAYDLFGYDIRGLDEVKNRVIMEYYGYNE